MTSEDLPSRTRRLPFEPFRVTLTTGATYDIRDPDALKHHTSRPIARMSARALLCWTTPGRIR